MFLTKQMDIRAINDEKKSSRPGIADDFWYGLQGMFGGTTTSGVNVNAVSALQLTVIYACVKLISESCAQLPLIVYRRKTESSKERARNYPLYRLLHSRPNKWQTSFEWREMMFGHALLRGNAYSEIFTGGNGLITDLVPRHPDRINIEIINDRGDFRYIYNELNGTKRPIPRGDMFHVRGASSDGYIGYSPIEVEREAIGEAIASQQYGTRFYENDAQSQSWIENPVPFKTDEAKKNFITQWQAAQTGSNRFKTPLLENGMKLHSVGIKHTDAQFLETRKYKDTDMCRIYLVPPHMIGILDRATFSNIEHQGISFVTITLMPWLRRFEECISRDLIVDEDKYYAEFLTDALMRGDIKTRYEAYSIATKDGGWMMRSEARERENMDAIPGLEKPLVPLNMNNGDSAVEKPDPKEPPPKKAKSKRDEAIKLMACQRVINKEVRALAKVGADITKVEEFYSSHVAYVSEILAMDMDTARKYCECSKNEYLSAIKDGTIDIMLNLWEASRAQMLAGLKSAEEM